MSDDSIITTPNSWLEWFLTHEDTESINRSSKKAIFEAFNATKTEDDMKAALLRHQETVFIFKQNFGINRLNVFHHLAVIGGNFHNKKEHFGVIQGIDKYVTCIMTPDMNQLLGLSTNEVSVPLFSDILKVDSEDTYRKPENYNKGKVLCKKLYSNTPIHAIQHQRSNIGA